MGHIDWVDVSPHMLAIAKNTPEGEYQNRLQLISFIEADIYAYLENLRNDQLDLALMKYTFDHLDNLGLFFSLLAAKLKPGGKLIANILSTTPVLPSYSTNARFLYDGQAFPDNETRTMQDGDQYTVKFFKVSGDKDSGYWQGGQVDKYYHSSEKIRQLAKQHHLDLFLGDWTDYVAPQHQGNLSLNQDILVLSKN